MKFLSITAWLFSFWLGLSPTPANAAIAKSVPATEQAEPTETAGKHFTKRKKHDRRLAKLKSKLQKKFQKIKRKLFDGTERSYLWMSLGLLVLAIVFFALSGSAGTLNVFGSVFVIGAVVFFVLWLLAIRPMRAPVEDEP